MKIVSSICDYKVHAKILNRMFVDIARTIK